MGYLSFPTLLYDTLQYFECLCSAGQVCVRAKLFTGAPEKEAAVSFDETVFAESHTCTHFAKKQFFAFFRVHVRYHDRCL